MAFSLTDDVCEVVSSWVSRKGPIPESWKGDWGRVSPMTSFDLQNIRANGCLALLSRKRKNATRLKAISDLLIGLSSAIQAESANAQREHEVVSKMSSLVTVPNEVFARILDCVVNGDEDLTNPARWKAALTLSHVNQYFRNIALSCARLWSNISQNSDMVSSSLSRSKDVFLDVQLNIGYALQSAQSRGLVFECFLPDVLPHSKRWRALSVNFTPYTQRDRITGLKSADRPDILQAFREADVRSLTTLHLTDHKPYNPFTGYHEFENWDAPSLQHLIIVHYFPLSLPALANITILDVTLDLGEINLSDLLQAFARMKVLEELTMKFGANGHVYNAQLGLDHIEKIELPRVSRLKISTGKHEYRTGTAIMSYFFSSLGFPNAIDLSVILSGNIKRRYPEHEVAELGFVGEVESIFQEVEQFPRVEGFYFEVKTLNDPIKVYGPQLDCHIFTNIPIVRLPSLKHLTLATNMHLSIRTLPDSNQEGVLYPKIETITIKQSSGGGVMTFVSRVLENQKRQGDWEYFRELVVATGRGNDSEEGTIERYNPDEALALCRQHYPHGFSFLSGDRD